MNRNYRAFLWHAGFFSLVTTFTDLNTVLPSLIVHTGGSTLLIGILTAIMIGTPILGQLFLASHLHLKRRKKGYLLLGVNLRVVALASIALLLWEVASPSRTTLPDTTIRALVMSLVFVFALAGSLAGIAYTDLLGKSLPDARRARFFVTRQVLNSVGFLISALIAREILRQLDYPWSYVWLFSAAAGLLLVASLGFWVLDEEPSPAPP